LTLFGINMGDYSVVIAYCCPRRGGACMVC
jgi:hypothetical protein